MISDRVLDVTVSPSSHPLSMVMLQNFPHLKKGDFQARRNSWILESFHRNVNASVRLVSQDEDGCSSRSRSMVG